jgi:hypothetical protein
VKISIPIYLVALLASFVYAVIKNYLPDLPLTEDQIQFIILAILALAGVDVTAAINRANPGILARRK